MDYSVLQVMNYAASYRGNFIESMELLKACMEEKNYDDVFLFCNEAKNSDSMIWINELINKGYHVEFLSDNIINDINIIKNIIKKYNVKLVHTHFLTTKQYFSVSLATKMSKTKIVAHFHNHARISSNKLKGNLRNNLYKKAYGIGCSESVFESMKKAYPEMRKTFVDNGVYFDRLDTYVDILDDEYSVSDSDGVFLIFGFDFFRKGVDLAVKAIDSLQQKGYKYTLLISLSRNFEEVNNNIISILGYMPDWIKVIKARNDVASLYNYCDLFLSPSREEGLPYSVVEAGYCKCSVVLSDISAQRNLRLKYAYWFEDGNVEQFADMILKAMEEHADKIQNWNEVKSYMRQQYSLRNWADKVVDIYINELEG